MYHYICIITYNNTLLLADAFETFREMCLKIYHLDPPKFLSAPGLAWQAALKKIEVKLGLLTDIDMLLMVEKGIRGRICHTIFQYANANNKYMKEQASLTVCSTTLEQKRSFQPPVGPIRS